MCISIYLCDVHIRGLEVLIDDMIVLIDDRGNFIYRGLWNNTLRGLSYRILRGLSSKEKGFIENVKDWWAAKDVRGWLGY